QDLRRWNNLFAFTSIRYNHDDHTSAIGEGFQLFQIHGAVYHHQGPLVPTGECDALYSQVYLYDPAFAAQSRSDRAPELDRALVSSLTNMLQEHFPFIQLERFAWQAQRQPNLQIILNPQMRLIVDSGADSRRENLSTADEVALILPEEYGREGFQDIVLTEQVNGKLPNHGFSTINPNHASYLPLHYVLLL
ncbi:hypothetical protein HOY82DRAFT_465376, partial [Tuber indicum]